MKDPASLKRVAVKHGASHFPDTQPHGMRKSWENQTYQTPPAERRSPFELCSAIKWARPHMLPSKTPACTPSTRLVPGTNGKGLVKAPDPRILTRSDLVGALKRRFKKQAEDPMNGEPLRFLPSNSLPSLWLAASEGLTLPKCTKNIQKSISDTSWHINTSQNWQLQ